MAHSSDCEEKMSSRRQVSFLSSPKPPSPLHALVLGTPLTKIRPHARQFQRYFWLHEDLSAISWTPSSKKEASVSLSELREVRVGKTTEALRQLSCGEERCFSLLFGDDFRPLDLVANSADEASVWTSALNFLLAARRTSGEEWLHEEFERADRHKRGVLEEEEALEVMRRLDSQLNERDFRRRLGRGQVDKKQFVQLFQQTSLRPELSLLLIRWSCGHDAISAPELQVFLAAEQARDNITLHETELLIHELNERSPVLFLPGFTRLLLSESLFSPSPSPPPIPCLVHLKIISGQHLPRPRNSSQKASTVDPYVYLEVDNTRIGRTRTREGESPLFEESFQFPLSSSSHTLRFLVLDDEFIGDDFIGESSGACHALQPGYRHAPLFSREGDALPNASLFVHVAFSPSPRVKKQKAFRSVGVKQIDDLLRGWNALQESFAQRKQVERAFRELREECSLPDHANFAQCLRVFVLRLASCHSLSSFTAQCEKRNIPVFETTGDLSPRLSRSLRLVHKVFNDLYFAARSADRLLHEMIEKQKKLAACTCPKNSFQFNCDLLAQEIQLLAQSKDSAFNALNQVKSLGSSLEQLFTREKANLAREPIQLVIEEEEEEEEEEREKSADGELRGILKKAT